LCILNESNIFAKDKNSILENMSKPFSNLFSDRELEVLKLLKDGFTSAVIAQKLFISKHTVDGHRRKMLKKSNCSNTIELINFSKNNGLL
jgi:DNA-binding NarL/FixJ family response regulator